MLLKLIGAVMDVDDRGLDVHRGKSVEDMIDQGLAADGHERLRRAVREGAHTGAEAGCKNHGAARDDRRVGLHHRLRSSMAPSGDFPLSRGYLGGRTWVRYQALSAASEGCASERCRYPHTRGICRKYCGLPSRRLSRAKMPRIFDA